MKRQSVVITLGILTLSTVTEAFPTWYSPTPYLSFADSPFRSVQFSYFYLEDFEDGALNTPGVSVDHGEPSYPRWPRGDVDSVDADDGLIDGSGNGGNAWWSGDGATGFTFTFDAAVLGSLPTYAGIVWTDGDGTTSFAAFNSLGVCIGAIAPVAIAVPGEYTGQTAEDRFFGVSDPDGIWKIKISNTVRGIEVDHLQYGTQIPVPGAILLGTLGTGLVGWLRRRRTM